MRALLARAARRAWHRRFGLALVVACVALATLLLWGVERVRHDARAGFSNAVSGTDLVVGARGGSVQLMLYAVFRIGSATNTIRWRSVQALAADPAVAWVVPISLGDSHRGYPVVGTDGGYFRHFRYGEQRPLALREGRPFDDGPAGVFEAVLGSEVAARLGHRLGSRLVLAHGSGEFSANDHADKPFTVVGVLAPTGTPVDRSVHISLAGMQAIHLDWIAGTPLPGMSVPPERVHEHDLTPRQVTAALVGLKSRAAVFSVQRRVAEFPDEPLMAVLPGVALDELWQAVGLGERALLAMAALVALVSLAGLVAVVLTGLEQRRRELAVLRAVGAGPRTVFALLVIEGLLVTALGAALGALAASAAVALGADAVQAQFGLTLSSAWPTVVQWQWLGAVLAAGTLASVVPGWRAYRLSLAEGLMPRA
jgi:putative ABC transport system permease protein